MPPPPPPSDGKATEGVVRRGVSFRRYQVTASRRRSVRPHQRRAKAAVRSVANEAARATLARTQHAHAHAARAVKVLRRKRISPGQRALVLFGQRCASAADGERRSVRARGPTLCTVYTAAAGLVRSKIHPPNLLDAILKSENYISSAYSVLNDDGEK
ncbi:unnamed protein product, partial [Iphiclides podalirius]